MALNNSTVLLLAAGRSSRMGQPKGLLKYRGQLWLLQQLEWLNERGLEQVILVLGFQSEDYFKQIPWLKESLSSWVLHKNLKIKTLINPKPERGSFSSLQEAISPLALFNDSNGAFLLPVDVPCPNSSVWIKIRPDGPDNLPTATVPQFKGKGGHPVYLNRAFLEKLKEVPLDSPNARLDQQIAALENQARIPVEDSRVLLNLNSPDDWENFCQLNRV